MLLEFCHTKYRLAIFYRRGFHSDDDIATKVLLRTEMAANSLHITALAHNYQYESAQQTSYINPFTRMSPWFYRKASADATPQTN